MRAFYILLVMIFISTRLVTAQESEAYSSGQLEAMSIPSSPAFSLLGVNPELVTRPSDVKEFKVDWRIKNYKLAPDLALEAQPLWWLVYSKKSPKAFLKMSELERILSTTSFSMATAKMDNVNHLAYALKFNLYKEYDPFRDEKRIATSEKSLAAQTAPLEKEIKDLEIKLATTINKDTLDTLANQIQLLKIQKKELRKIVMENYATISNKLLADNWNMSMIDLAVGRVYKYDNAALDSLRFEKAGFGIWLNASKKLGKNGMLTGMVKMNKIGVNRNSMLGASYRYGSHKYNFFLELVRSKMNNIMENGFAEGEQFSGLLAVDLGTGWYKYAEGDESYVTWTVSYGGDFRLSNKVLLNFALRTELTGDLKITRFLPVANIICLMK